MTPGEAPLRLEHAAWGEGSLVRIEGTDWIVLFEGFGRPLRFPAEARSQLKVLRGNASVKSALDSEQSREAEDHRHRSSELADSDALVAPGSIEIHSGRREMALGEETASGPTDPPMPVEVAPSTPPMPVSRIAPDSLPEVDWRLARRAIESLSVGLPPVGAFARRMAINFDQTERLIWNVLNDVHQEGGAAVIIKGEYGQGKTFALRCLEEISIESGFLVARTEVDATENQLSRPHSIYRDLMRNLRVPGEADGGVDALVRRAMQVIEEEIPDASELDRFNWLEERLGCQSLAWLLSDRNLPKKRLLVGLLAADPAVRTVEARGTHWSLDQPRAWPVFNARTQGDFACFLLSGIGRLARMIGLKGLIIIMDEMEKWQDLHWSEQTRAGNLLGGLIWGATTESPRHLLRRYPGGLEHSKVCGGYPFTTIERNHVGIAIAMTPRSEVEDPEAIWTKYGGPILDVDLPRINATRLGTYCQRVAPLFAEAYSTCRPSAQGLKEISQDAIKIWREYGELTMRSAVQSAIAAFHNWRDRG